MIINYSSLRWNSGVQRLDFKIDNGIYISNIIQFYDVDNGLLDCIYLHKYKINT